MRELRVRLLQRGRGVRARGGRPRHGHPCRHGRAPHHREQRRFLLLHEARPHARLRPRRPHGHGACRRMLGERRSRPGARGRRVPAAAQRPVRVPAGRGDHRRRAHRLRERRVRALPRRPHLWLPRVAGPSRRRGGHAPRPPSRPSERDPRHHPRHLEPHRQERRRARRAARRRALPHGRRGPHGGALRRGAVPAQVRPHAERHSLQRH